MIESLPRACAATWLAKRSTFPEFELKPIAHSHSRCSKGLGAIVWACRLVNTGQSASLITLAVVEPSSICRKMPECLGMIMRSNLSSLATRSISGVPSPDARNLSHYHAHALGHLPSHAA